MRSLACIMVYFVATPREKERVEANDRCFLGRRAVPQCTCQSITRRHTCVRVSFAITDYWLIACARSLQPHWLNAKSSSMLYNNNRTQLPSLLHLLAHTEIVPGHRKTFVGRISPEPHWRNVLCKSNAYFTTAMKLLFPRATCAFFLKTSRICFGKLNFLKCSSFRK